MRLLKAACLLLFASCSSSPTGNTALNTGESASIEGTVRDAGSDAPVPGASVFLVRSLDQLQVRAITDAKGSFSLPVDAGRHVVAATRDGYVVPGRQESSGHPFVVTKGQRLKDVIIRMVRAGTITGRVFRQDGSPAPRVEVQLLQNLYLMGRPQWSAVNRGGSASETRVSTNERGEFRATGVDPGKYIVRFIPREITVESRLPGGVSAFPLLYPDTRELSKAAIVDVQPGQETLLDDVKLKQEQRRWIRVRVMNESGEPLEGFGTWSLKPPDWVGSEYPFAEDRITEQFHEFQPDSPGVYDILATWSSPAGRLAGFARVDYRKGDVEIRMPVRKGETKVTGRVTIEEGGSQRPVSGADIAFGPRIAYFSRSGPDGMFTFPEVYAGRYRFGYVRGVAPDMFVLSAKQGSRDVLQDEIVVEGKEVNLEIVVSAGGGVLQGRVIDDSGRPVHNGLVALVPDQPLRDRKDYYGAYRDTRTDQNGNFEIFGITPGEYKAYAWSDAPATAFRNAEFIKTFEGKGTPVRLEKNGKVSVELKSQ